MNLTCNCSVNRSRNQLTNNGTDTGSKCQAHDECNEANGPVTKPQVKP